MNKVFSPFVALLLAGVCQIALAQNPPAVFSVISMLAPENNEQIDTGTDIVLQTRTIMVNQERTNWVEVEVGLKLFKHHQSLDVWQEVTTTEWTGQPDANSSDVITPKQVARLLELRQYEDAPKGYYRLVATLRAKFQGGNWLEVGNPETHFFHVVDP